MIQDPLRPLKKRQQGGGMLGMAGGTIQQLLNGAVIRSRGQVRFHSSSLFVSLYLSLSLFISLYLSSSLFISLYLSSSLFISLHLSSSLFISLYLSLSLFIFLYLYYFISQSLGSRTLGLLHFLIFNLFI